ncbi:MAG TPA: murein biosynthesis integral membrane protein MurJ [Candidatus Hydrogenedentes bacterium]|nr:murein biosynthesis integral membrane protein MurJ [Candidatus Hydrogenedentota bacterium]HIJ73525.1 murein biosynthesis integral membrane protein MurJ [Candidatus Hydrogenedentota bacterium]
MDEPQRRVSKFAAIFAGGTMVSRLLGLVRDIVCGKLIGAVSLDAFLVAFKLPNMLRDIIGEGASNAAFVPVFSESLEKESEEAYRELVSAVMSAMLVVLAVLTIAGVILAPMLLRGLNLITLVTGAKQLDPTKIDLMASLARWTFPYLFLIGMTVFAMAPLFTKGRYAIPSWSPTLLSIAVIVSCLLLRDLFPDQGYALVFGVWLGGVAQLAVQYVAMGKHTGVWRPNFRLNHPGVRAALWLLVPVLFGQAAGEINKLVDTLFAASLETGTVKALSYANRLVLLPLSVFAVAISVAVLPTISKSVARGDLRETRATLMQGFRQTCFLILPAMLGLIVLRKPIVTLLFQWGEFSAADAERTATALGIYGAGLLSFAWVKVAVAGFYAAQNTRTPVVVASMCMALNIVLNVMLVRPLQFRGLALATTISFTANFLLLYIMLCDRYGRLWDEAFINTLTRIVVAAVAMAAVAGGVHFRVAAAFETDGLGARTLRAVLPIAAGLATYVGLCSALRVRELGDLFEVLRGDRRRG